MIHSYHTSNAANLLDQTQKIAIVGATGSVGQIMLEVLNEFGFTADQVIPLASKNSAGLWLPFGDEVVKVEDLEMFDFTRASFCLFSAGGHVSSLYAPKAVAAGAIVIDNTSHFRMDPLVPLIVPEVNPTSLCGVVPPIIANPNCALAQIAVALKPLHDLVPLKRITVATYQSVSGAGKKAMNELTTQTQEVLNGKTPEPVFFKKPIAFNIIPQIGCLLDNGYTDEEWKIREELQKILDPMIEVSAMCVRVPIFIGHSCAIHAQCVRVVSLVLKDKPDTRKRYMARIPGWG